MIDLSGRVCLISGAGQGIGRAVAEGLARRGATVVATGLEEPKCEGVALNRAWDVAQAEQAPRVIDEVLQRFGRFDVFVANAGIYPRQEWHTISTDDWCKVLGVNCLMPGAVLTPTELEHFPDQETIARLVYELQCLPGRIETHDIEPSFAFLCSEESDPISGQVLCVDHGLMHW